MVDTPIQGHTAVGGASARGKPDPDVRLPPAVKAAADRAEALSAQAKEARDALAASGGDQPIGATQQQPQLRTPPTGVMTANFDPRNPNPPTDVPSDQNRDTKPRYNAPQAPTITNATTPAPQAPTPQTPDDWEHQFKSLKGRYDQEAQNNRRMSAQITDMQRLMASVVSPPMQSSPVSAAHEGSGVRFNSPVAGGGPGQHPGQRKLTAKEIAEYGEELIDVMGRRAQEIYEPILQQVVGELNQIKRQVGGVQNTVVYDARVRMYDDLAKEVPNWDNINNSPEFAHWLDQIDPISRQARRTFLNGAHNSNQTGQVVDIFKGFLAHQAAFGPANGGQSPGNGAGGYSGYSQSNSGNFTASTPQVDLAAFAAPGRAKSGQTQVPPEKPIFNAADIPSFYRDKIAGKYAGREAEADAIERALFDAQKDGRIRR